MDVNGWYTVPGAEEDPCVWGCVVSTVRVRRGSDPSVIRTFVCQCYRTRFQTLLLPTDPRHAREPLLSPKWTRFTSLSAFPYAGTPSLSIRSRNSSVLSFSEVPCVGCPSRSPSVTDLNPPSSVNSDIR